MSLSLGIVGLPNVGKSSLFNALTKVGAKASNFPFCTIDPNVGVVPVPDHRLDRLSEISSSAKTVNTSIEFIDIAGLVRGASKGEGLGNQFLANIREASAILHVVRCFKDENVVHVDGDVDPLRDIENIELELLFADLATIERRIDAQSKRIKSGDKKEVQKMQVYEKIKTHLEDNKQLRTLELSKEEKELIKDLNFLTTKPVIYVANISEDIIGDYKKDKNYKVVEEYASKEGAEAIAISSKIESELAELSEEESKEFLASLGMDESGLNRLIKSGYKLLDLITYFTSGPKETRAWTIKRNTRAPQAAGVIHTDFERGFIKAEVISYEEIAEIGSFVKARDNGVIRQEGKDYIMQDGDVVEFKFNV